jgi:hypothetical protein
VIINEVLTHVSPTFDQAIEFYNPSGAAASIGGWYLSDDIAQFQERWFLAGFLPLFRPVASSSSTTTSSTMVFPGAFALNRSRGGELWLSEADAGGNLTGVRVKATYGAALNGVSIGRHQTSIGVDFVALSALTLANVNSYPKVGPVVINEIMYHPPDIVTPTNVISNTDDEFVELRNVDDGSGSLAGWRLRGGISYTFPSGSICRWCSLACRQLQPCP